ncbi:MAG: hypothetical protein V4733_10040 [Verrucomicrobiota bacterium]
MSHEKANLLYQATKAAEQQFEYFLTGAIGAMFAYTVQNYTPHRLDLSPSTLEPLAIVCLAGAFFCGLKRIECLFHHSGISYQKFQELGDAQVTEDAIRLIVTQPEKHQPRQGSTIESIAKDAQAHRSRAQSADPLLDSLGTQVRRYYTWRNSLMLAGFSLIVAAKIAAPYFAPTKPPIPAPTPPAATQTSQKPVSDPTPPKGMKISEQGVARQPAISSTITFQPPSHSRRWAHF